MEGEIGELCVKCEDRGREVQDNAAQGDFREFRIVEIGNEQERLMGLKQGVSLGKSLGR